MSGAGLPIISFLSGSLMFSFWLVRLSGRDPRAVGDGNPGAVNAFKVAGPVIGSLGLLLDFLKGAIPVGLGYWHLQIGGLLLALTIIAPVLGHAFSPWLRFRGGKAIAVTFGVWCGITFWEAPCVLGGVLLVTKFIFRVRNDAVCVMLGMMALLIYVVLRLKSPALIAAALGNALVIIYKHRLALSKV